MMKIFLIVSIVILSLLLVHFDRENSKADKVQAEILLSQQDKKYEYELTVMLRSEKVIVKKGYSNSEYDSISSFVKHSKWIKETKDGLEIQTGSDYCFIPTNAIQMISIRRNEITKH